MSAAREWPATELLPVPPGGAVGGQDPATVHPPPMPNYSGAETDGRLVELWLARKARSTRACLTVHEGSHIINEAMTTIAR